MKKFQLWLMASDDAESNCSDYEQMWKDRIMSATFIIKDDGTVKVEFMEDKYLDKSMETREIPDDFVSSFGAEPVTLYREDGQMLAYNLSKTSKLTKFSKVLGEWIIKTVQGKESAMDKLITEVITGEKPRK